MNENRVAVAGLSVCLGEVEILHGISLVVGKGEFLTVIGPNGAGKSTLLRCLDGLLSPAAGEVQVDGRRLADYSRRELARVVSYVPQGQG